MNNFEQDLEKLEELSSAIKRSDITLEEALKAFEEGIKLANGMEKQLDAIEGKIQILMKEPSEVPVEEKKSKGKSAAEDCLELFDMNTETNGTRQG